MLIGVGLGYAVAISLPEEQRQELKEMLVTRGSEVVDKLKDVGRQQAEQWAGEVRQKAKTWVEQNPDLSPFIHSGTNGTAREESM